MGMQGKVLWFSGHFLWKSGVSADVTGSQDGEEDPAEDEEQGAKAFLIPCVKRERVRTWSSWAAKRGKKGDHTQVVHTLGMKMAKNLSKGQYECGEDTG